MAPKSEIAPWCKRPSCATVRWKCDLTFVHLPCHSVVGLFCSSAGALSCWVSSHFNDHRDHHQDGLCALWFQHLLACRLPEPQALIWPHSNQVSVMTEPPVDWILLSQYVQMEFSSFCIVSYYSRRLLFCLPDSCTYSRVDMLYNPHLQATAREVQGVWKVHFLAKLAHTFPVRRELWMG